MAVTVSVSTVLLGAGFVCGGGRLGDSGGFVMVILKLGAIALLITLTSGVSHFSGGSLGPVTVSGSSVKSAEATTSPAASKESRLLRRVTPFR